MQVEAAQSVGTFRRRERSANRKSEDGVFPGRNSERCRAQEKVATEARKKQGSQV